jgi:hypothetical protein
MGQAVGGQPLALETWLRSPVWYVVHKVALIQVFLPVSIIPPMLHTHPYYMLLLAGQMDEA